MPGVELPSAVLDSIEDAHADASHRRVETRNRLNARPDAVKAADTKAVNAVLQQVWQNARRGYSND